MHRRPRRKRSALAITLALACAHAAPAQAGPKTACADAAERGQALRNEAKLRGARAEFLVCARPACPPVVSSDCIKWLGEVQARIPTVVVHARDSRGRDVVGVRVLVDGAPLVSQLEGVAVPVDPGPHRLRFEAASGAVVEQSLAIVEGEKGRYVAVTFDVPLEVDGQAALAPRPTTTAPATTAPATTTPHDHRTSPSLYVAGAVGLLGLASFTYFELRGQSDYRELRDGCARTRSCAQSEVDTARSELVVAVISLGVTAVAAGVFTWLLLRDDGARPATAATAATAATTTKPRIDVSPRQGGGVLELRGLF
jgi:hypothetical protein